MSKCICALGKRGITSREWFDGKKDRIYCFGKYDKRTDDLLPECEACLDNVNKAQEDLDEWNNANIQHSRHYSAKEERYNEFL